MCTFNEPIHVHLYWTMQYVNESLKTANRPLSKSIKSRQCLSSPGGSPMPMINFTFLRCVFRSLNPRSAHPKEGHLNSTKHYQNCTTKPIHSDSNCIHQYDQTTQSNNKPYEKSHSFPDWPREMQQPSNIIKMGRRMSRPRGRQGATVFLLSPVYGVRSTICYCRTSREKRKVSMLLTSSHAPAWLHSFWRCDCRANTCDKSQILHRMHLCYFKVAASNSQDTAPPRAMAFHLIWGYGGHALSLGT